MLRRGLRGAYRNPGSVARRFAAFFWERRFAAAGAVRPDRLLEEREDQAGDAGDHQDQADGVDADALDVDVRGVAEDRSDGDQEYRSGNGHGTLATRRYLIDKRQPAGLGWQEGHQ
jgi:hypothetical protein